MARKITDHTLESRKMAKAVGVLVAELRKANNLSQEKLAELANCHRNNIGLIERGERTASMYTLRTIAEALGESTSTLLKKSGY